MTLYTMNTFAPSVQKLITVINSNNLTSEDLQKIYQVIGDSILGEVLTKYLATLGEWEQSSFVEWVERNSRNDMFMSELLTRYPDFGKILTEEILKLQNLNQPT